jgi:YesN/AraC family two-component response regulator
MGDDVRVLIVDDQDYIRRGLRAFLADEPGIEICGEALNGSEAIDRATNLRPDVIMDISMPILDGLRATSVIRRNLPSIEVITLSQYELPAYPRARASERGFERRLPGPRVDRFFPHYAACNVQTWTPT